MTGILISLVFIRFLADAQWANYIITPFCLLITVTCFVTIKMENKIRIFRITNLGGGRG
jgi:hypothetical protein